MDESSATRTNTNAMHGQLRSQATELKVHTLLLGSMRNFVYLLEDITTLSHKRRHSVRKS